MDGGWRRERDGERDRGGRCGGLERRWIEEGERGIERGGRMRGENGKKGRLLEARWDRERDEGG